MSFFRGFQEIAPVFRLLDDYAAATARRGVPSHCHPAVSSIRAFQPRFDVREVKDAYELQGELPGIAQKDISVEWEDNQTLTISGRTQRTSSEAKSPSASTAAPAAPTSTSEEASEQESSSKKYQASVEEDGFEEVSAPTAAESTTNAEASTEVTKTSTAEGEVAKPIGKHNKPKYWVTERSVGEFRRTWTFPSRVDQENVRASLKDGILSILVPKASPPQPKKITIE